jgi:hypothetical protein
LALPRPTSSFLVFFLKKFQGRTFTASFNKFFRL